MSRIAGSWAGGSLQLGDRRHRVERATRSDVAVVALLSEDALGQTRERARSFYERLGCETRHAGLKRGS